MRAVTMLSAVSACWVDQKPFALTAGAASIQTSADARCPSTSTTGSCGSTARTPGPRPRVRQRVWQPSTPGSGTESLVAKLGWARLGTAASNLLKPSCSGPAGAAAASPLRFAFSLRTRGAIQRSRGSAARLCCTASPRLLFSKSQHTDCKPKQTPQPAEPERHRYNSGACSFSTLSPYPPRPCPRDPGTRCGTPRVGLPVAPAALSRTC